jgi:hypothetical protein
MRKNLLMAVAAAATMAVMTAPAGAILITATDYDSAAFQASLGAQIPPTLVNSIITASPPPGEPSNMGTLTSQVFRNGNIFSYVFNIAPAVQNISGVNTGFAALGFNGVAGYSFSNATAGGTSFDILYNDTTDLRLAWLVPEDDDGNLILWGNTQPITFFFQSTLPPGGGAYNLINRVVGSGVGYASAPAPVPEPGTLMLVGFGLAGVGALGRRLKVLK